MSHECMHAWEQIGPSLWECFECGAKSSTQPLSTVLMGFPDDEFKGCPPLSDVGEVLEWKVLLDGNQEEFIPDSDCPFTFFAALSIVYGLTAFGVIRTAVHSGLIFSTPIQVMVQAYKFPFEEMPPDHQLAWTEYFCVN